MITIENTSSWNEMIDDEDVCDDDVVYFTFSCLGSSMCEMSLLTAIVNKRR
jgi:hypothetical protein